MPAPVLLLRLGDAPDPVRAAHGAYHEWFERAWGGPLALHDGRAPGPAPDPRAFAAIVVSGSPESLARPEPWMDDAADLVRRAAEAGTAVLGVCFGHQLVGHAFGARVVPNPRGWEIGTLPVRVIADDPIFEGLGEVLDVNLTHEDVIDPASLAGTPLRALAASDLCDVQAIAVGDLVRGVQFHPEIDGATCRAYIAARRERIGRPADARDAPDGVAVMRNFRRRFVG